MQASIFLIRFRDSLLAETELYFLFFRSRGGAVRFDYENIVLLPRFNKYHSGTISSPIVVLKPTARPMAVKYESSRWWAKDSPFKKL